MKTGFQIRTEMPFQVTDAHVFHLAMKGSACWSVQRHAQRHEVVRAIYEQLPGRERLPRFA